MSSVYSETLGQGKDVVLLHGWGLHSGIWQSFVEGLAKQYRVHMLDLPGHGYSHDCQVSFNLESVCECIENYITSINKPVVLLGWSLGGLIALSIVLRKEVNIEKLVLLASTPCFVKNEKWSSGMQPQVFNDFAGSLQQDYKKTLQRFVALQTRGSDEAASMLRELRKKLFSRGEPDANALMQSLAVLQQTDLSEQMKDVMTPVMLLNGDRDTFVSQQSIACMESGFSNVTSIKIEKCGHAPFISHADVCIDSISSFINA